MNHATFLAVFRIAAGGDKQVNTVIIYPDILREPKVTVSLWSQSYLKLLKLGFVCTSKQCPSCLSCV